MITVLSLNSTQEGSKLTMEPTTIKTETLKLSASEVNTCESFAYIYSMKVQKRTWF